MQYICQRISAQAQDVSMSEAFKSAALDEMAHILYFSDLITRLGRNPKFTDWDIDKSDDLNTMLEKDIMLEKNAIEQYTIQFEKLKDYPELYSITESVLNDEEEHREIYSDFKESLTFTIS